MSIDGLQPEHDARRHPATYDRIQKHIVGHQIVVHCTVTRQQINRPGYLEEFLQFWSTRQEVRKIWMSLYTPQLGEISDERLPSDDRRRVVSDLMGLRLRYPKLEAPEGMLNMYAKPPAVTRRVRVCAHDSRRCRRTCPLASSRASSAARQTAQLRMRGVGGPGGGREPQTLGFVLVGAIFTGSSRSER